MLKHGLQGLPPGHHLDAESPLLEADPDFLEERYSAFRKRLDQSGVTCVLLPTP